MKFRKYYPTITRHPQGEIQLNLLALALLGSSLLTVVGCQSPAKQSRDFRQAIDHSEENTTEAPETPDSALHKNSKSIGMTTPLEAFPVRELEPVENLTLAEAANRTLGRNREWRMALEQAMQQNASAYQNQLLPNPNLSGQWENVFGSGNFSGTQQLEETIQLSQSVPIGGRIAANRAVTRQMRETTFQELEAVRLELLRDLGQAFIRAYAAQLRLDLSAESKELNQQVVEAVQAQRDSGKVSPVELAQAQTQLSLAKAQYESALRQWIDARAQLGKMWNEPVQSPSYQRLVADWKTLPETLNAEIDWARLQDHPRMRWMEARLALADKRLKASQRAAYPDVNIQAAYRELKAPDEQAYVFGVSVPIPLFDRNQGNIEAARRKRAEAEIDLEGALFELEISSKAALSQLESSWRTVKFLNEEAIPSANTALTSSREGYKSGKLTYIETLNAQQAWIQAQRQLITATEALHLSVVQLETQLNAPLSDLIAISED